MSICKSGDGLLLQTKTHLPWQWGEEWWLSLAHKEGSYKGDSAAWFYQWKMENQGEPKLEDLPAETLVFAGGISQTSDI